MCNFLLCDIIGIIVKNIWNDFIKGSKYFKSVIKEDVFVVIIEIL